MQVIDQSEEVDPLAALDNIRNPFLDDGEGGEVVEAEAAPDPDSPVPSVPPVDDYQQEASDALAKVLAGGAPLDGKKNNKNLRDQLRDRNQAVERLNGELAERELRVKELEERYGAAERESKEYKESLTRRYEVTEYEETSDPAVRQIDGDLRLALQEAKMHLPQDQGALLESNMVVLVQAYQKGIATGDSAKLHKVLSEHFPDRESQVMGSIREMNKHLQLRTKVIQENRSNHYQSVIGRYDDKYRAAKDQVSLVGGLSMEEAIKTPTALNAIVSVAAKHDDGFAKELQRIQAQCAMIGAGVRPFDIRDPKWRPYLDPSDPMQLSAEGLEVRSREVFQYESIQRDLPKTLCQMWAAASLVPNLVRRLAEYESRVKDEQGEPDLRVSEEAYKMPGGDGVLDFEKWGDPTSIKNPFV